MQFSFEFQSTQFHAFPLIILSLSLSLCARAHEPMLCVLTHMIAESDFEEVGKA
jgi:hypothetical protein